MPALAADCPLPAAFSAVDDTAALLTALEGSLVGRPAGCAGGGAALPPWNDAAGRLTKVWTRLYTVTCFLDECATDTAEWLV